MFKSPQRWETQILIDFLIFPSADANDALLCETRAFSQEIPKILSDHRTQDEDLPESISLR